MKLSLLTILYSAGIVQALIFVVVLSRKDYVRQYSNRILIAILLAIFAILVLYTKISPELSQMAWLGALGTVSWFALGPLFYLYAKTKTDDKFRLKAIHLLLFAFPAYNILHYLISLFGINTGFYLLFNDFITYSYAWLFAYLIHGFVFSLAALKLLRAQADQHGWLLKFFYLLNASLLLSIIYLAIAANPVEYYNKIEQYLVVVFDLFVVILTVGSLRSSEFFLEKAKKIKETKYTNSSLTSGELQKFHKQLEELMAMEKPYLNRKLTLAELAQKAAIRENQLSQIFSQLLKSGFYDFVNGYRLKELEERLTDSKYQHLKIASLAEDCGFNSKAAFYKTFKEKHGQTPTQYLKAKAL